MWFKRNKIKPKTNIFIKHGMRKDSEKSSRLKIISKYLKLYYEYSTINSLKYFADSQRPWFERILWIIIHYIIISCLVFMVYISYKEFMTTPLVTSKDTDDSKTTILPFPANNTNLTVDEILNLIMQLGNLYISNFETDNNHNVELDKLLTTYYKGLYDVTKIMKDLTPQCSMMLSMCKLHGSYKNCSSLFKFRKTQDGYCCTFNYVRESDDIPEPSNVIELKPLKVLDLGIERGLTVVMDPLWDDYFYSIFPIKGWKVVVFNPTDYPDMTSGGVTEILAIPLSETFLDVVGTLFVSNPIIKNFPRNKRNCIFSDEGKLMSSDTTYTYSDCIVDCKINYIQKSCGCRPFFYPRRGKKDYSWRTCNSLDFQCLAKHKSDWLTILPHEEEHTNFEKKIGKKALHCYNCYAACEDLSYDIISWKTYMTPGIFNTNLLQDYNVTNEGIVHVFFSKYGTVKLKQDMSFYWYDLVGDIGGICGVFIGFSFISVVELLYFFVLMFSDLFCKKSALQEDDDRKTEIPSNQTTGAIYWNELQPRSWHSAKYGKFSTNRARY